ncbi:MULTISPECIES: MFS transporter [Streptomyces]|uniref:MFS transporter n=1 Tax=Streptomyces TaxID=1883 RepID=UPI00117D5FC4|nr:MULTISPECIES: MFS transporter [Streptomyces]
MGDRNEERIDLHPVDRLERSRRVRRLRFRSAVAFAIGLALAVGSYFMVGSAASEPPGDDLADGDIVGLITALAGLISALGGALGGYAALIMARRTTQQERTRRDLPPDTGNGG